LYILEAVYKKDISIWIYKFWNCEIKINNNFLKNLLFSIFTVSINILFPFIFAIILLSEIGQEAYGEYVKYLSLVMILFVIGDMGLSLYTTKNISKNRYDNDIVSENISFFFLIKSISSLVMIIIILFMINQEIIVKIVLSILIISRFMSPYFIFQAFENYSLLSNVNLSSKVIQILLAVSMDYSNNGVMKAFLVISLVPLVFNIYLYLVLILKYKIKIVKIKANRVVSMLKESFNFYIARLFLNLYTQGSTFFVSFFISLEPLAIYSLAVDLYKVGDGLVGSISRVLFTRLNQTINFSLIRKLTVISIILIILFLPIVLIYGETILGILFDVDSSQLYYLSFYLYLSLIFTVINAYWGYPAFSPINKDSYANISLIGQSLTYFCSFILLISFFEVSLFRAILCIIFADFSGAVLRIFFASKEKILFNK
jgi:O-antigen/teichoic acid export membrane protein